MDRLVEAHVFISGRVQGVFYRASTRDKAVELGLSGWVRNLPDGRVEALFQGDEEKVKEMIAWCERGPSYSSVSNIDVEFGEVSDLMQGFEVRYSLV